MSTKNLIPSYQARLQKRAINQMNVLRFLRQHIWSIQEILQKILGFESRQAAHRVLTEMEKTGLLKKFRLNCEFGAIILWGITPHGQALAFDLENESPIRAYFEPSRISPAFIYHHLDLQELRITAEKNGWSEWVDGDRLLNIPKDGKRPDALVFDPNGKRSAIEAERTLKTEKRYVAILTAYLMLLKKQEIDRVIWVSPTADISARVRKFILGIKNVNVAGQSISIDPLRHHQNLYFTDYSKWPDV